MENDKEAIQDEVLVVAAILGDLKAFDELVRRYRQPVLRLAKSIAGPTDADDIAQDVWLLAFKSLPGIDNPQKFAAWLMVITRHRALRHRKKASAHRARQMPMDLYLLEQFSAITMPATPSDEDERINKALDALPVDYSMVMKMKFFDAVPLKKIASFLDVPLSTVKWRIYKGKALLLDEIKRLDKADEAWRNR